MLVFLIVNTLREFTQFSVRPQNLQGSGDFGASGDGDRPPSVQVLPSFSLCFGW